LSPCHGVFISAIATADRAAWIAIDMAEVKNIDSVQAWSGFMVDSGPVAEQCPCGWEYFRAEGNGAHMCKSSDPNVQSENSLCALSKSGLLFTSTSCSAVNSLLRKRTQGNLLSVTARKDMSRFGEEQCGDDLMLFAGKSQLWHCGIIHGRYIFITSLDVDKNFALSEVRIKEYDSQVSQRKTILLDRPRAYWTFRPSQLQKRDDLNDDKVSASLISRSRWEI
jgi:hypothetical protein